MSKVLIVEDDTSLSQTIKHNLEKENINVEVAHDLQSAIELLTMASFDLAVLDWNLPDGTGIEACRKFRANGGTIPILMLTARSMIDEKQVGYDAGVDDYLTKPFEMRELIMRIKAGLRRASGSTDHLLRTDDIVLDPTGFWATRGGRLLSLVRKEFTLLEFLMRHQNQIFSSEALVEHLWGLDSEVSPDAARVTISRLKKKLGDDGKNQRRELIESIYGVGYRLIGDKGAL